MSLIDQYREMHQDPDMFAGTAMLPRIGRIAYFVEATESKTLLDYGSGKGRYWDFKLEDGRTPREIVGAEITLYDPAVEGLDEINDPPRDRTTGEKLPLHRFDGVICMDVLEHTEPGEEGELIQTLFDRAFRFVYASIPCIPAKKTLPDGRNCHTNLKTPEEWAKLFFDHSGETIWEIYCLTQTEEVIHRFDGVDVVREARPLKQKLHVKARNCVENETIREQIQVNQDRSDVKICEEEFKPHDQTAVIVGGSPFWPDYIEEIREHVETGGVLFCTKASHNRLTEEGIIPFGCFLLDPRGHSKYIVSEPHPSVRYICASMVHPSVLDALSGSEIWLYHAATGANEVEIVKKGLIIGGGTTSGTRAIGLLHAWGFRKVRFYGFDSCIENHDPKAHEKKIRSDFLKAMKTIDLSQKDLVEAARQSAHNSLQKFVRVDVDKKGQVIMNGSDFWTTYEWVAQKQDFDQISHSLPDMDIEIVGPGLIPTAWSKRKAFIEDRKKDDWLGQFADVTLDEFTVKVTTDRRSLRDALEAAVTAGDTASAQRIRTLMEEQGIAA